MTKTQYYVAASVDGFITDREGSLDWLMQFGFEEFDEGYRRFLAEVGVVVMGSGTYEWLLREGESWAYPQQQCWVLSSRELPLMADGEGIRFASAPVGELHPLWVEAADGKNIWIVGGGSVAAQVADAGLLDEIILSTMPVVLGAGTPLLPLATASGVLGVSGTEVTPSGAITTVYSLR